MDRLRFYSPDATNEEKLLLGICCDSKIEYPQIRGDLHRIIRDHPILLHEGMIRQMFENGKFELLSWVFQYHRDIITEHEWLFHHLRRYLDYMYSHPDAPGPMSNLTKKEQLYFDLSHYFGERRALYEEPRRVMFGKSLTWRLLYWCN